jgi:hypothetical protein
MGCEREVKVKLGETEVRRMQLVDLKPASYNPRKISSEAMSGLSGSIDKFGLMSLIVWNEQTGNIVGGHQRYKLLVEKGETETDVVVVSLDNDSEVALNIALNNPKMRGDFTKDVVELLEKSEVQIGNRFKEIGLDALHNYVKRLKFGEHLSPKEAKPINDKPEQDNTINPKVETVVTCPHCRAMWQMKDNKVISNGEKADSDEVGNQEN